MSPLHPEVNDTKVTVVDLNKGSIFSTVYILYFTKGTELILYFSELFMVLY